MWSRQNKALYQPNQFFMLNREVNMLEHQIPPHKRPPGLMLSAGLREERKAKMLLGIVKLKRYHGLNNEEWEQVMKMACELLK
ncbi:hypothetical protein ACNFJN_09000 [Xenorhabdus budapestensis]|uniref:Uncharacterized protein n=1 Tax=Xenorhabdus budapestensis TaxID=290110 RepID=A0ABX7VK78_XENBU|nr:hypothetical protein [Xenorhabdus budapestensis]QTL41003.1 hypothetical protein HGO23_06610 [Xenorhabdus budapestensis]